MVWHMSTGDRVLDQVEAKFYLTILQDSFISTLVYNNWEYNIKEFELWVSTGNGFLDRASFNQQIFLINFCLKALLKQDVPMPELDHLLEASAFYPFAYLQQMINEEIDNQLHWQNQENKNQEDEYTYFYRKIAWDAVEDIMPDLLDCQDEEEDTTLFKSFYEEKYRSQDMRDWEFVIDSLADIIFWDRDWFFVSTEPELLDGMEPALASSMGITENYFTNRLPKVTDQKAIQSLKEIMEWEL
ncbi:hypothetical protein [Planktothrix mougeotii]|uniref:Uncharacterized protein n=1 Tax=Planktothrix mougeotii LEGE 06226 TaxID=1828728 RepID=A0ABR9UD39_9CYAN|nr:hypothetical protein [Planktothrix mougeotii]MBE9143731.1 hypothetical protein [Planktothrix mougeotii LEGE 06226]